MPAGWYPDQADEQRLRWWDGAQWTDDFRPLLIDMVPDFDEVSNHSVPVFEAPAPVEREPAIAPVVDITSRLAATPERSTPAPTSRRQLRELLGRPLTTNELPAGHEDIGFTTTAALDRN